jgi:hypothetical protein
MFDTAKGSQTIFARGGNDQFHINYDQLGAHSALNLMGQGGDDFFGVNDITADLLQPASSDQQVNIYGGKGHDRAEFYYEGEGDVHTQDVINTANLRNVESVAVGATLTHGKVIGTNGDDVLLFSNDKQRSYLLGGAGADHLIGGGLEAAAVIYGGDGRDVIGAAAYHTEAVGGAGGDYFFLVTSIGDKLDFHVTDFERGSDHFLIADTYDHFFDLDPSKAKQDNHEFRKTIDFHDGTIFYKDHAFAEVEGVTHLSSSDFVFL